MALGYTRLDLNTWAGNLKAVPLYKKSGYFWVPETSVRMENYPLIFRLPRQELFRQADWYRDFRRDLALRPTRRSRASRRCTPTSGRTTGAGCGWVIDRAQRVGPWRPTGSPSHHHRRPSPPGRGPAQVRWRVENRSPEPLPVSILAEARTA